MKVGSKDSSKIMIILCIANLKRFQFDDAICKNKLIIAQNKCVISSIKQSRIVEKSKIRKIVITLERKMIRMKKFITSAYGISSIDKLIDVVFSFEEFQDIEDEDLDFQDKDITEFIDKFLEAISTNKNLNSLVINDKKLLFDACVIFKNLNFKQLKQFTLITNDDIFIKLPTYQELPLFIESLVSVTHLQLNFNKTDFPQILLTLMAASIGKLQQLKKLNLSFKFSKKFNDEVMLEFCKHLIKLDQLEELYLDLDSTNIGNEGLIELGHTISKMPQIRKLFINVQRNAHINEKGSTKYFNYLLAHPNCYKFETQMIFQFEDKELNPNFKAITNFQVQVKALTQSKKTGFSTINYPFYSHFKQNQKMNTNFQIQFTSSRLNFPNTSLQYLSKAIRLLKK